MGAHQKIMEIPIGGETNAYAKRIGQSWQIVGHIIFPGTDIFGTPKNIKAMLGENGIGNGECRIYDSSTALDICFVNTISGLGPILMDLGVLSNLPTTETIFEIHVKHADVAGKTYISNVQIQWY